MLKNVFIIENKIVNEYKIGDKVMIKNFNSTPGASPKLIPRFKRPYQVNRVL